MIVINSDDEDLDLGDDVSEDEDEGDIWAAEAHTAGNTREATPEISNLLLKPELIKPQRSKLPSPWRRSSGLIYSDDVNITHSDLSGQTDLVQAEEVSTETSIETSAEGTGHLEAPSATPSYIEDKSIASITSEVRDPSPVVASVELNNDESTLQREDSTGLLLANQLNTVRMKPDKLVSVRKDSKSVLDDAIRAHRRRLEIKQQDSGQILPASTNSSHIEHSIIIKGLESSGQSAPDLPSNTVSSSGTQPSEGITALIDPFLLDPPKQPSKSKSQKNPKPTTRPAPLTLLPPTSLQSSTWLTYLTKPFLAAPTPSLPPPATCADILVSSPHEPLLTLLPGHLFTPMLSHPYITPACSTALTSLLTIPLPPQLTSAVK